MSYRQSVKISNQKHLINIIELCTQIENLGVDIEEDHRDIAVIVKGALEGLEKNLEEPNPIAAISVIKLNNLVKSLDT